jgi:hypothetical protein
MAKEFVIEDFTINNDNSIKIEYYFYSQFEIVNYTKEELEEVFGSEDLDNWLREEFNQDGCITLLKYYIRDYAKKK